MLKQTRHSVQQSYFNYANLESKRLMYKVNTYISSPIFYQSQVQNPARKAWPDQQLCSKGYETC